MPDLVTDGEVTFSEALLFVNGRDKPPMSKSQMVEFLEIVDSIGEWPFVKGDACAEFGKRYIAMPGGWFPTELSEPSASTVES